MSPMTKPFSPGAAQQSEIIAGSQPVLAPPRVPKVLSIAGSDPSGGAGIQGDLKTIAAHGGYGMAALTALTAQNTQGVRRVHIPPPEFLRLQLEALSNDIEIDAVKIGMLSKAPVVETVAAWLKQAAPAIVVFDPVMVATSGDRLLDADAVAALHELIPLADLITPNLAELTVLTGQERIPDWVSALELAQRLAERYQLTVLLKGGHLEESELVPDALVGPDGDRFELTSARIDSKHTHGTGCSLSSAMATLQVRTGDWTESLSLAKPWLVEGIRQAVHLEVGQGNGPVQHFPSDQPSSITQSWWQQSAELRGRMMGLEFLSGLAEGSLPKPWFDYYLMQDALYLEEYSRALARVSALCSQTADQMFWIRSSLDCLEVEAQLHRDWLTGAGSVVGASADSLALPGPVTRYYTDHLHAACATGEYGVAAAAMLPCFWVYAWVGEQLEERRAAVAAGEPTGTSATHPYARWLDTYADEEFRLTTTRAIEIVERAGCAATPTQRERMREAFRYSCEYELEFFDAPRLFAG
nr:bifunctional hydroxymethylpyrimidine kinase/phosphomethylpyrimidine kinase [Acaricomes phytoseiuli]